MQIILIAILAATPSYDTSSWDLSPGSIPRTNGTGDTLAGVPVISDDGIVTDPAQVSGTITNLLSHSYQIVASETMISPWLRSGLAGEPVIYDGADAIAPDGTLTASKFDIIGSGVFDYSFFYRQITGTSASYTASIWLRSVSGTGTIYISLNTGIEDQWQACSLTTNWQRCSVTRTLTSGTWYFFVGSDIRGGQPAIDATSIYAGKPQIEIDGNLSTPGPYVATTTTSSSGVRGEYNGQPSDPGILVPVQLSDPRTWGVGISASKVSWAGSDALVDLGGQLSGYRWNSARLETTAAGALVLTVIDATGASATRTVAAHEFADGSTHKLAFGAFDGIPFLLVDGVSTGTLTGTAVLSSFPSTIGINSTVHPVAKTVYRVSQGPTPWSAQVKLK